MIRIVRPTERHSSEKPGDSNWVRLCIQNIITTESRQRIVDIINAGCLGASLCPTQVSADEALLLRFLETKGKQFHGSALRILDEEYAKIPDRIQILD